MSQIIRDMTEIARCGAQYKADRLSPMGLKGCHASYLTEICAHPGISQDQLAKRICINKSNVARQAATLEEEGFLTRIPSHSFRTLEISGRRSRVFWVGWSSMMRLSVAEGVRVRKPSSSSVAAWRATLLLLMQMRLAS